MRNLKIKNIDCHAALAMTKNGQTDVLQYGRSMIEMLGVLAIIGVLSVGGIAGYSKAMMKYRINKTIEQITLIAGNIRTFFANQRDYGQVWCNSSSCDENGCDGFSEYEDEEGSIGSAFNGCPIIKKAKILPDDMITVTDGKIMSITNPFGGSVELSAINKAKSGDNQAFEILLVNIPQEACIELMTSDWYNANVKAVSLGIKLFKIPVELDLAVNKCAAPINNISFYFDIDLNGSVWKSKSWQN